MIDPPGSTGAYVGFFEEAGGQPINPAGAITGTYFDASGIGHGFLRSAKGIVASFDPPGSTYTIPQSINAGGAITGFIFDASGANHAFLRAPDGTFTTFDAPDGMGSTAGEGINSAGTIVGYYFDANFFYHGFVRGSDGTITEFDVPDAALTIPSGINSAGAITGTFYDVNFNTHCFLRAPDGTITTFDPPGANGFFTVAGASTQRGHHGILLRRELLRSRLRASSGRHLHRPHRCAGLPRGHVRHRHQPSWRHHGRILRRKRRGARVRADSVTALCRRGGRSGGAGSGGRLVGPAPPSNRKEWRL